MERIIDERILLRLRRLRTVSPVPAEKLSLMFFGHGAEQDSPHDEKDHEEDDGNDENRHTSPLAPFWDRLYRLAVMPVTGGCECLARVASDSILGRRVL